MSINYVISLNLFILLITSLGFIIGGCAKQDVSEDKIVVLETNQGIIEIKLMPDVAPKACENFEKLVASGYYDGIIFHRVIKDFMIEGGESVWGKPFEDEGHENVKFDRKGLLAMANSGPNTNGSQFFITTKPTPWLHMRHTIFGEVISDYEVVENIETVEIGLSDRPLEEQKILKAFMRP